MTIKKKLRVIYYKDGEMRDLEGSVKTVELTGDTAQAFRTCSVKLNNTRDGRKYAINFKNGGEIRVQYLGREVFRGLLFKTEIDVTGGQSLTAYDYNVMLTKNSDSVRYVGKTASQILADLCGKYGITVGPIANTKHVIPRFIVRGKSLYEIVTTALTETRRNTGKRYRITNRAGKLELVEVSAQTKLLVLENGRNITGAAFSESIEDVKTRVKLTGGDEAKPFTEIASSPLAKEYGVMQHYEHNSDVKKAKELKPLASALLAELSKPKQEFKIDAIGDIEVISAVSVAVKEEMTGIKGSFYVQSDSHTFNDDDTHTMSLSLTRELTLEQIVYEDPTKAEKPKKAKKPKKPKKKKKKEKPKRKKPKNPKEATKK